MVNILTSISARCDMVAKAQNQILLTKIIEDHMILKNITNFRFI